MLYLQQHHIRKIQFLYTGCANCVSCVQFLMKGTEERHYNNNGHYNNNEREKVQTEKPNMLVMFEKT